MTANRMFCGLLLLSAILVAVAAVHSVRLPEGKNWIDLVQAMGTPSVALLAAHFTWKNYQLTRAKRQDELFDRRFQLYRKIMISYYGPDQEGSAAPEPPFENEDREYAIREVKYEVLFVFGKDIQDHCGRLADRVRDDGNDFTDNFDPHAPFVKYLGLEK